MSVVGAALRPGLRAAGSRGTHTLVLLRHGESTWNAENRFTGWVDVPLTSAGSAEAAAAGRLMRDLGLRFDLAFTSYLKRAIKTLWIVQEEMDMMWLPVERSWRLNERHYGALQGLNKQETLEQHGYEKVVQWRRSYDIPPPSVDTTSEHFPGSHASGYYYIVKLSNLAPRASFRST